MDVLLAFHDEQNRRLCQLLGLSPDHVQAALRAITPDTYTLYLLAKNIGGESCLHHVLENQSTFSQLSSLVKVETVVVRINHAEPIHQFHLSTPTYLTNKMNEQLIQMLLPFAVSLKSSLFILHYDGTYLGYFEAGNSDPTVVPYNDMIGRYAMDKLPEPMRTTVKTHFQEATATGQPVEYLYTSPRSGKIIKSIVVPYPHLQQVAVFVMDAEPSLIPA